MWGRFSGDLSATVVIRADENVYLTWQHSTIRHRNVVRLPGTSFSMLYTDYVCVCVSAQSFQSCSTLCDPMNYSLPGSSVPWRFSRQEYWSQLPRPPPGDFRNPGIELTSLASPALEADSFTADPPRKPILIIFIYIISLCLFYFLCIFIVLINKSLLQLTGNRCYRQTKK